MNLHKLLRGCVQITLNKTNERTSLGLMFEEGFSACLVPQKTFNYLFFFTFMSSVIKTFSSVPTVIKLPIFKFITLIICPDVRLQRPWQLLRLLKGMVHPKLTALAFVSVFTLE